MRIKRNTILEYVPTIFKKEKTVSPSRIKIFGKPVKSGKYIIYLCERELRAKDNFALQFAIQKSVEHDLPVKLIHPLIKYEYSLKNKFISKQIIQTKKNFNDIGIDFEIYEGENISEYIKFLEPKLLIVDFNPIADRSKLNNLPFLTYEIDGHNIIPVRYLSQKQEYNAATIRNKIYQNIFSFLTKFDNLADFKTEADSVLESFIFNKLDFYADFKNDFNRNVVSGLSKYINSGFISSQRIAIEVIKSETENKNKEAFLEELIVRKELADNFCLYSDFKNYSGIPNWAKQSLDIHKTDIRNYNYTLFELEKGETHDDLWNAAQKQLLREGTIHGYLRMYWAKKIFEWSRTPKIGLNNTIYLNDKYAFDSPSANGYTGILWALGGLHDRAFTDWRITGKIRRMTYNSIRKKFDTKSYIDKYLNSI